jgi:hypothetical protein
MTKALYTAELKGKLKLNRQGEWFHEGRIFERKALSDLFHRSIVWDPEDKEFFIQIGKERARFEIEDVPFFVSSIRAEEPQTISLLGGHTEELNPKEFYLGTENQIYYRLQSGHEARLTRAAHQHLMTFGVSESEIHINGVQIILRPRK